MLPGELDEVDCLVVTCSAAWLILGALLAVVYVRIIFGPGHPVGEPPRYCAITVQPRGWPVRVRQGSLYVYDYRIHHWLVYLVCLPVVLWLQAYTGLGWSLVLIVHGLWYDDRFVFKDTQPRHQYEQADETVHLGTLQEGGVEEDDGNLGGCIERGGDDDKADTRRQDAFVIEAGDDDNNNNAPNPSKSYL